MRKDGTITLGDLARALGYAPGTVSRALRGDPTLLASTREKIVRMAETMGYRPDPAVAQAMARVRASREGKHQETLAILHDESSSRRDLAAPYTQSLIGGMKQRATKLGYTTDEIWMHDPGFSAIRLHSILSTRGIRGLLIPPQSVPVIEVPFPIARFIVVAAAPYVVPAVHRVFPDNHNNFRLAFNAALQNGFRRIGLLDNTTVETRMENAPLANYLLGIEQAGLSRLPVFHTEEGEKSLIAWVKKQKPDCILGPTETELAQLRRAFEIPRDFSYVCYGHLREGIASIDKRPEDIGAAAVDILTTHLAHNEMGIPPFQKTVLVQGRFVTAPTLRKRPDLTT